MKTNEIATTDDLQKLKDALIAAFREEVEKVRMPEVLKSADVKKILGCSDSTLQSLRLSGQLPGEQILGTWYYNAQAVRDILPKYQYKRNKAA